MPAEPGHKYGWQCGICENEVFPVEDQGYYRAQQHQSTEHAGQHGVIRGVVDLETGEVVVPGFGPRVLQKAQKEGYAPAKSAGGGGSGSGGGGKKDGTERMPSGTRPAGVGVRSKQMFREVQIHLPTLEPLFQRCRDVFAESWEDSDAGFSAWLHDTIMEAYRPHVLQLFGGGTAQSGEAESMPSREELAALILDPSRILDGDLPQVYGVLFEALIWAQVAGPYQDFRSGLVGGEVA